MLSLAATLLLLPCQLGVYEAAPAAEDALYMPSRAPMAGETDVPRNAAFMTTETISAVAVVAFDAETGNEELTPGTVEVVEGISIGRLPVQPALADVTVRLTFNGGFTEDVSWTTGNELIEAPVPEPEILRAEATRPFLQNPYVEVEIGANDAFGAAVLTIVDGEELTRASATVTFGAGNNLWLSDYSYTGGTRDYEVLVLDRAGNLAEPVPVTVSTVGCASTPAAPACVLALALLALRRRRGGARV